MSASHFLKLGLSELYYYILLSGLSHRVHCLQPILRLYFTEKLTSLSNSSPTPTIIISAKIENKRGYNKHPCLTSRHISPGSESSFYVLTTTVCCMYRLMMSLLSLQSTAIVLNTSKTLVHFTLSKANKQLYIKL